MNEICWKRTTAHSSSRKYAPVHDVLLYYARTDAFVWNEPRTEYDDAYLAKYYRFDDGDGRLYWRDNLCAAGVRRGRSGASWRGIDPSNKGMHWKFTVERLDELDREGRIYWPAKGTMPQYKRYRDELRGKAVPDIWDDIDRINPVGSERLGYPTQKPVALLERIISASSNPGDLVLDPFCGCGTTIHAAQQLGRQWIGVDITHLSIALLKYRLKDAFGLEAGKDYAVVGEPQDLGSARQLAEDTQKDARYQFQWWALSLVRARPIGGGEGTVRSGKKGADRGIDGVITFIDDKTGAGKRALVQVKSGHVTAKEVRDLRGTVEREKAQMGVFITLEEPTGPMQTEAVSAGYYHSPGWNKDYPVLQIVTVKELLAGAEVRLPPTMTTFRRADKAAAKAGERQGSLFDQPGAGHSLAADHAEGADQAGH